MTILVWYGYPMINWIAFNNSFIFPQLKHTSENECNFSAEERARKNEHGFSFLEAVKVHITRISIFLETKNSQTRKDWNLCYVNFQSFQKRESVFIFVRVFFCRKLDSFSKVFLSCGNIKNLLKAIQFIMGYPYHIKIVKNY